MENASKALLMAASVLIAMMVIGIATYVFNMFGTFAKNQEEELYNKQIGEFNAQFTKYETMEEINIHDIITLANYAKDYNNANEVTSSSDNIYITVELQTKGNIENKTTSEKNKLIEDDLNFLATNPSKKIVYKVTNIQYNEVTERVNKINFSKTIQNKT